MEELFGWLLEHGGPCGVLAVLALYFWWQARKEREERVEVQHKLDTRTEEWLKSLAGVTSVLEVIKDRVGK